MTRYILLAGNVYYPAGWDDYKGVYDTFDAAKQAADEHCRSMPTSEERKRGRGFTWAEVIDLSSLERVYKIDYGDISDASDE